MVAGFIPGFLVPALIGIIGKETRSNWLIIFIISACIIFSSALFFVFSIRPEIQEFDEVALKERQVDFKKSSTDADTEGSVASVKEITPRPAIDFSTRAWPFGIKNVHMSVWDKSKAADIQKIFIRVSSEINSPSVSEQKPPLMSKELT